MITKNQQKTLDNLTSQFEKLNVPQNTKGGLINVGAIQSQFNVNQKRKTEIEINNAEFSDLRQRMREDAIDTLNKDLVSLGLIAKEVNTFQIKITLPNNKHLCYTKEIDINVDINSEIERVGNDRIYVNNGVSFVFSSYDKTHFDTIEEVISYGADGNLKSFHSELQRLYNSTAELV